MAGEDSLRYVVIIDDGDRLDKALTIHLDGVSRSQVKQWITNGRVHCHNVSHVLEPDSPVLAGQTYTIDVDTPKPSHLTPRAMDLDIIYEDAALVVINKPAGLVVHPAPGHRDDTLVNGLLAAGALAQADDESRPGVVHRIDKDTSGLIVLAKTVEALRGLSKQFADRQAGRAYLAVVKSGLRPKVGLIDAPIGRHRSKWQKMAVNEVKGREAQTSYRVLQEVVGAAAVLCRLATGRTHQIRVHFAHLGFPIIGDRLYGNDPRFSRQALHALRLSFVHPVSGEKCSYVVSPPPDMCAWLETCGFMAEGLIQTASTVSQTWVYPAQ